MGRAERDKGARGERMLKEYLNSLGLTVQRGYVFLKQSDLVNLPGIHVECKFVEKLSVRKAMDQAIEEAKKRKDGMPAVFWKVSRKPWLTVMRTEDWVRLYKLARLAELQGAKDERQEDIRHVQGLVADDQKPATGKSR